MISEIKKTSPQDEIILKTIEEIDGEKEQDLVNLIVEIIVSITLKEYYEESD